MPSLKVTFGRGYVPAEDQEQDVFGVGTIAMDALYSPVQRVNYNVGAARVGQKTDYDSLSLELWTDGSIKPEEAISLAAKVMKEQMQVFINFDEDVSPVEEKVETSTAPQLNDNLFRSVDDLELVCS